MLAELKANEAQYKQVLSEKDAAMERQQAEIEKLAETRNFGLSEN